MWRVAAVVVVALGGGCVSSSEVTCSDGRVCPGGAVCDQTHGLCVQPGQLTACNGLADTEPCTTGAVNGTCHDGVCIEALCGDGIAVETEQCDRDDLKGVTDCAHAGYYDNGPVSCTPQCTLDVSQCSHHCGDGVIDMPQEQCDGTALGTVGGAAASCQALGYYDPGNVTCTPQCRWDVSQCTGFCGDGTKNGPELCEGSPPALTCVDAGYDRGATACSNLCTADQSGCGLVGWHDVGFQAPDRLTALFGFSATDVTAIGWYFITSSGGGPAWWHYDGTGWTKKMMNGVTPPPGSVAGSNYQLNGATGWSTGEIVAVGIYGDANNPPIAIHYDGATWTTRLLATSWGPHAAWGTGPSDVYAVSAKFNPSVDAGDVDHWDGTSWTTVHSAAHGLFGVWGASGQIFAVGRSGTIEHFNGTWTSDVSGTGVDLNSVWGTSTSDVFAVGASGTILHNNGSGWSPMASPTTHTLLSVWGLASNDVFASGGGGTILHYDGVGWTVMTTATSNGVAAVWGASSTDVHSVGIGEIMHYNGDGWETPIATGGPVTVGGVWGVAENAVLYESSDIYKLDGKTWTALGMPPVSYTIAAEVWGTSADDFYVAAGQVHHYTAGSGWAADILNPFPGADGVWGFGANNVYVVGELGTIYHYTGTWALETSGTTFYLDSVWGSGPNDVFAVGDGGTILHDDGSGTWTAMTSGTSEYLLSVHGTGPNDVYAAGFNGTILHYDGVKWTTMTTGIGGQLTNRVYAAGPNDAFAVGAYGVIHWDGAAWSPVRTPTTVTPNGVYGIGPRVYISEDAYQLVRHTPW